MDFIERLFGIAPDNGSGWLEFSLLLALSLSVALGRWYRRRAGQRSLEG